MSIFSKKWMQFSNSGNSGLFVPLGLFTGGSVLNFAPASGVLNNVNPGGAWPSATIGRLEIDTTAGNVTFTGLVASVQDGHGVLITNTGANVLTLASLNAGSSAANQFRFIGDLTMPQDDTAMIVYYTGIALWVIH